MPSGRKLWFSLIFLFSTWPVPQPLSQAAASSRRAVTDFSAGQERFDTWRSKTLCSDDLLVQQCSN
jgi:hypothetical protein